MFDIGFWELLLIAIVALVVVGPERLPKLIRVVGLWVGKANASVQSIRSEISRELRAEELKQALNKTVLDSERSINSLRKSVDLTDIENGVSMGSDSIDLKPNAIPEQSIESDPIEKEGNGN